MRNIWVAVIGVLTLTLFAGSSFATAPVAGDIPDIKLLTGSGTVDDFDLDAYVSDYDDDESGLDWTIDSAVGFDSGDPSSITDGHLVDLAGKSAADQGVVTYKVSDATEQDTDSQTVKYSSFLLVGPSLTQDNNLAPPDAFVRSWVIKGEESLTTPAIATLLSGTDAVNLTVSIADLAGNLKAGDNVTDVVYGDLHASISGDGKLVLTTPTGAYPRALGQAQLTGAYRVGVKAKATGGGLAGAEDNWDGMEILAAVAQYPSYDTTNFPASQARLSEFCDFEVGTVPKAIATSQGVMRAETDPNAPKWFTSGVSGGATAQIVGTGIPASSWATSGNALKVGLGATGGTMVVSEWFTDFAPGETLTLQANVTCDAAAPATTGGAMMMFVGNFHAHGNYQGTAWNSNATYAEIPNNGSWRTMKITFPVDTVGANVQNGTETFNAYQRGYQIAFYIQSTGAAVNYYIDNVRIYRNLDPIDMALASTVIDVTDAGTSNPFDGTMESVSDLAAWAQPLAQGTARLDNTGLNNMFSHEGTKAIEMFLPAYAGTKLSHQLQYKCDTGLPAHPGSTPGILGVSAWVKSDAPDAKSCPDVMAVLSDPGFRIAGFASTGYVGMPQAGAGWKKLLVTGEHVGITSRLWLTLILTSGPIAVDAYAYWPTWLKTTSAPGAESDAHIFFDDIKFHKMLDDAKFFDRSVFPATD